MAIKRMVTYRDEVNDNEYTSTADIFSFIGECDDGTIIIGGYDYDSSRFFAWVKDTDEVWMHFFPVSANSTVISIYELEQAIRDYYGSNFHFTQLFTDYSALGHALN